MFCYPSRSGADLLLAALLRPRVLPHAAAASKRAASHRSVAQTMVCMPVLQWGRIVLRCWCCALGCERASGREQETALGNKGLIFRCSPFNVTGNSSLG